LSRWRSGLLWKYGRLNNSKRAFAISITNKYYQNALLRRVMKAWINDIMQRSWRRDIRKELRSEVVDEMKPEVTGYHETIQQVKYFLDWY
jgi:Ni,Fe-hydrogenase I cytochrome b subunit